MAAARKVAARKAAAPKAASKPSKVRRVDVPAAGYIIHTEVVDTPDDRAPCSVCGTVLEDGACPNGHTAGTEGGAGGWHVEGD